MELISTKLSHKLNINEYFNELNSCFLDIETTGLDRSKQIIYLIGLLFYDKTSKHWILNQYFANKKEDERKILDAFMRDLSSFDNLISYNGDRFDIPFINHRLKVNGIDNFISLDNSYDIYKTIRKNKEYLKLENLKLKTVEESLGYHREDIYSGFDCIAFFYQYTRDKNPVLKERILKHNSDDLFYMLDIIEILDVIHSKKTISINSNDIFLNFTIGHIDIKKDTMSITGFTDKKLEKNIKFFSNKYNISTNQRRHFKISIDIDYGYVSQNEKCAYIDSLDYPNSDLSSDSKYNIPSNIFILKVEKDLYLDNIKLLLKHLLKEIL